MEKKDNKCGISKTIRGGNNFMSKKWLIIIIPSRLLCLVLWFN